MTRVPVSLLRPKAWNYVCTNGHSAQSDRELDACPVMTRGKPCDGELKRVGRGSRKEVGK